VLWVTAGLYQGRKKPRSDFLGQVANFAVATSENKSSEAHKPK